MVDARKDEIYGAVYARPQDGAGKHSPPFGLVELVSPRVEAPGVFLRRAKQFDPFYVGSGTIQYRAALEEIKSIAARIVSPDEVLPSTVYLCGIARELPPLSHEAVSSLEPRYIRSSDAVLKPLKPINPHE
jgi:tRNA A37 threonylcarbamoyladenosine modification protein TsaB